jgi:hypothetical protein
MWLTTLFQRDSSSNSPKTTITQKGGELVSSTTFSATKHSDNNDRKGPKLVVAGKMTIGDQPCNIAQMSLKNGNWSLKELTQLSLYNSYSGGEVYYILANHSFPLNNTHASRSLLNANPAVSVSQETNHNINTYL